MSKSVAQPTHGRIAGLDLIRAIAIILVMIEHAWQSFQASLGIVGVVIFFTLSGYLITGVLERDIIRFGRVRYGHFYRNRVFRLVPALLVVTAAFAVAELVGNVLGDRARILHTVLVALTYTGDIPGINEISQGLSHLWTLSVEEQFYILWPLLLVFGLRRNIVGRLQVGLVAVSLLLCVITLIAVAPKFAEVYRLPTSWAPALVVGTAAYLGRGRIQGWIGKRERQQICAGVGGAVLIGIALVPDGKAQPVLYLLLVPLIGVATVTLIVFFEEWRELPTVWLKPVLYLGTISYGMYLWNYLIAQWLHTDVNTGWQRPTSIVLTILAGTLSWYLVERPVQRLKPRLDIRSGEPASDVPEPTIDVRGQPE